MPLPQIRAVYNAPPDFCIAEAQAHFSTPQDAFTWFKRLQDETRETFIALHIDCKNRLICVDVVSTGSLTASVVHPREVLKTALLSNAAGLILLHNHPSGDPQPSKEDIAITEKLKGCCDLFGLKLLDHVVIGRERYCSLSEMGYLG